MGRSGWARTRGFPALIDAIHIDCPALWGKEDIEDAAKAGRGTCHPLQGVLRLMELAGIQPMLYAAVSSGTLLGIQKVPLSLEGQGILFPNQVWSADIHLCPDRREAPCILSSLIDWFSRYIVCWKAL